ncbi:MAG: hypothetical protein C0490_22410 [Marivirga sp.]|nr:hypothetical protein [Marivirga sp.]
MPATKQEDLMHSLAHTIPSIFQQRPNFIFGLAGARADKIQTLMEDAWPARPRRAMHALNHTQLRQKITLLMNGELIPA